MDRPRNPFILGHRIERPYFCDRVEEQKRLTDSVLNGRNVVLMSQRRMGKTSLVYISVHNSEAIHREFETIFVDILQTNSLAEFTYLFGKAIFERLRKKNDVRLRSFLASLKSLTGSFGFDPLTGAPSFNVQLGDIRHPEYTLDEIFEFLDSYDSPLIIMIDEFQQVSKYQDGNAEAILRTHIQRLHNATFIFAGSEYTILKEMFVSSKRPFYNSAELMHLGAIEKDIYAGFAVEMFRDYDKDISKEVVGEVYELFSGNTFYMQRALNGAFGATSVGEKCSHEVMERSIREMLGANEVVYREILSGITRNQKAVMIAIAKSGVVKSPLAGEFIRKHSLPSASAVQTALEKLLRIGHLTRTPEGYQLTDPLLRLFLLRTY